MIENQSELVKTTRVRSQASIQTVLYDASGTLENRWSPSNLLGIQPPQSGAQSIGSCKMRNVITLTALVLLSAGCFEAQKAAGCNNIGVLGCKDKPSEIEPPDPALKPAPVGGRHCPGDELPHETSDASDPDCLRRNQHPKIQSLNGCMTTGGVREQCVDRLLPEVLIQLEAWEAERAGIRRRHSESRQEMDDSSAFGVRADEPKRQKAKFGCRSTHSVQTV